ncbi:MAG: shikimate dehydrogenase [Rhodobacteraceae bacterium]|nr:shikimate dehydrogenase [Paracoccaceae bacterium]
MTATTHTRVDLQLGLIGDNIARSRSPLLHRLAGRQNGIDVAYDRLIPVELGLPFEAVFDKCRTGGYRGINVTYPYKERVVPFVTVDDALVRAVGAVNTVIFGPDGPKGYNTDHSGFVAAYRGVRGDRAPGIVCLIGTGGVGRAVAFGLVALEASEIRLVDRDLAKAEALAADLRQADPGLIVTVGLSAESAAAGAQGLVNCTPVGMVGYGGTPLPRAAMTGAEWAFDAVYTPVDTQFLTDATAEGLDVVSGYELFIYQGVHAWALFAGLPLDEAALRQALIDAGEDP